MNHPLLYEVFKGIAGGEMTVEGIVGQTKSEESTPTPIPISVKFFTQNGPTGVLLDRQQIIHLMQTLLEFI